MPSSLVLEIVYMDDTIPPPSCKEVIFQKGELHISKGISRAMMDGVPPDWVHIEPGLKYFEDVTGIVMVRGRDACTLWFSRLQPPPPSEVLGSLVDRWLFNSDGSVTVIKGEVARDLEPREKLCVSPPNGIDGGCKIILYNHGIIPTWVGIEKEDARVVFEGDSVSGRFSGPGDRRIYTIPITKPGMLIVEYRSDSGPGSIDIFIMDEKGRPAGTGGATFRRPQDARVELLYRGYDGSDFDAGFLFTPDTLLDCTLEVRKTGDLYRMIVDLENRGDEPVEVYRLDAGTVTWYADKVIIGGAHPGRLPEPVFLEPGRSLSFEKDILFEGKARFFEARIDLPFMPEGLRCLAEEKEEER